MHGHSLLDFNRSGVSLVEIVTESDFQSAEETIKFAKFLCEKHVLYEMTAGVMAHGNLRIDLNISLVDQMDHNLTSRVEVKNLNSFRALRRTIDYEVNRQSGLLYTGGALIGPEETRRYCDEKKITIFVRPKESSREYMHIPEPDLEPLIIEEKMIEEQRSIIKELTSIHGKARHGSVKIDCLRKTGMLDIFERVMKTCDSKAPKIVSEFLINDLRRIRSKLQADSMTSDFIHGVLVKLAEGRIANYEARKMITDEGDVSEPDDSKLKNLNSLTPEQVFIIKKLLDRRPSKIGDPDFFMGPLLKTLNGFKADPIRMRALIANHLRLMNEG